MEGMIEEEGKGHGGREREGRRREGRGGKGEGRGRDQADERSRRELFFSSQQEQISTRPVLLPSASARPLINTGAVHYNLSTKS